MKKKGDDIVLWLDSVGKKDLPRVGGKCANLGELISAGVEVPPGFAVTADAFKRFLSEAELEQKLQNILEGGSGSLDPQKCEAFSKEARGLVEGALMPQPIERAIREAYRELCRRTGAADVVVAVRSSATSEDLPDASFAGQQETYLNVRGEDQLVHYVRKCWSSLYTPRAIFYRSEKGFEHDRVWIAVGVQQLVPATASGVAFTMDPVTGDPSKIVIEAAWGLGEAVVAGRVRPDRFVVDKSTLRVLEAEVVSKSVEHVPNGEKGLTMERPVPPDRRNSASLTDEQVADLARLATKIESHYGGPQDIEFAIDGNGSKNRIFIVQARPETVWSNEKPNGKKNGEARGQVLKGLAASPGVHAGPARIVSTTADASKSMKQGEILVTKMTNPDWVPYMRLAGAIVTDDGGTTCHAAIVSREMGVPCIVGAREATKRLKTGETYTVDAKAGVVYGGVVEELVKKAAAQAAHVVPAALPVTSTKVYVNISLPELAEKVAHDTMADGVGLLRAEHMLLSVGKHPRLLIEEGGAEKMVEAFADNIRKVAAPFAPRPVVYRFLDFKPDEFLSLPGGQKYEQEAGHVGPNPLLGYRGTFRYLKEPDIFRLECRAVKKVREEFKLTNVHVMLPFVRTLDEFRNAKAILEEEGLVRHPDFKLWIMVEVPSTVLLIDEFIKEGFDGVSFGTNDLTMLILGLDRDDASVAEIYDERNLAVVRALSHVIRICEEQGVTTSICGQAPSNYPELVEFLVRQGVTSLSVNPDRVIETKQLVAGIERKLILQGVRNLKQENGAAEMLQPRWAR